MSGRKQLGQRACQPVDVPSLAVGEIGGMSLKTEKKIQLEIGDKIKFFVREFKKKKIA